MSVPRGRQAEAARNDERILAAARDVFVEDPEAPVSAVAERAGVGIGALYRRYPSKEDLVRRVCADGLARYIAAAEAALEDDGDPWVAFVTFMRRLVDTDTHALTARLAGRFTPTEENFAEAGRAQGLNRRIFERTRHAGALRPDAHVNDLAMVLEQVVAIKVGDAERTSRLRHRYLALLLDALHTRTDTVLPGPPPTWAELAGRWVPSAD